MPTRYRLHLVAHLVGSSYIGYKEDIFRIEKEDIPYEGNHFTPEVEDAKVIREWFRYRYVLATGGYYVRIDKRDILYFTLGFSREWDVAWDEEIEGLASKLLHSIMENSRDRNIPYPSYILWKIYWEGESALDDVISETSRYYDK